MPDRLSEIEAMLNAATPEWFRPGRPDMQSYIPTYEDAAVRTIEMASAALEGKE